MRIYERLPRDKFSEPFPVIGEKRNEVIVENRNGDAGGKSITCEFVFQKIDLQTRVLSEGWVIQSGSTWWAIDSIGTQMLGQRIHCQCSPTVDPNFDGE